MARKVAVVAEIPADWQQVHIKGVLLAPVHTGGLFGLPEEVPARLLSPTEIGTLFAQLISAGMVEVPVDGEDGTRTWHRLAALEIRIGPPPAVQSPDLQLQSGNGAAPAASPALGAH